MTVAQVVYDTNGAPKIQDAGSSFTKGISTFDTESAGFKALVKCSTQNAAAALVDVACDDQTITTC